MNEKTEMMDEIDLKQLLGILRDNLLIIVNFTIAAMIVAALFSFVILDKQYESYTTLMLGKSADYNTGAVTGEITSADVNLNRQLITTYSEIAKSRVVTSKVIENLGLNLTQEKLASMITVSTLNNTEIIKITVRTTDPILASQLANELASTFNKYVAALMRIDNINVIDVAQASNKPVAPRSTMNVAIGGVLGLMLGVFISFLKEILDTRLKSPDAVSAIANYPILAMVPESPDLDQSGGAKK